MIQRAILILTFSILVWLFGIVIWEAFYGTC